MDGLRVYFDLQSLSALQELSQAMKNSMQPSSSSPSKIHELRMVFRGWYTCSHGQAQTPHLGEGLFSRFYLLQ